MYANTCSEWIEAMGTIINAQIMCSKCMPTVITAPLCMKFLNESSSFLRGSSTHRDSKVIFNGLNRHKVYYNSSQEKIGFIPHKADDIPVPPQFKIPSSCQMNMSPHELELMLFINENFCHRATLTKSWNGPIQLLMMGTSLMLQATPRWKIEWTTHSPILLMVLVSNLKT
jgi:hypothetical protein